MVPIGKGVEYALHCLLYLIDLPPGGALTIANIAEYQGISESYLAKIFTQLKKAGLVTSSIGSKGGYELARPPERVSYWDVVVAIEGEPRLFECREIRGNGALYRAAAKKPNWSAIGPCEIHKVMLEAEAGVRAVLEKHTLAGLSGQVKKKVSREDREKTEQWFSTRMSGSER